MMDSNRFNDQLDKEVDGEMDAESDMIDAL